jgi:hypothetical protein
MACAPGIGLIGLGLVACRLSPVACRLQPVACRLSPVACSLSPAACRLQPVALNLTFPLRGFAVAPYYFRFLLYATRSRLDVARLELHVSNPIHKTRQVRF